MKKHIITLTDLSETKSFSSLSVDNWQYRLSGKKTTITEYRRASEPHEPYLTGWCLTLITLYANLRYELHTLRQNLAGIVRGEL